MQINKENKNPCNKCLVRGCCKKRENECELLQKWNHRNDWIVELTSALLFIPCLFLVFLTGIIRPSALDLDEEDYY